MKFKRNLLILSAILIGILIVVAGCVPATTTPSTEEEADAPTNGTISVAAGAATTNDTTPTLTLSSTGATYMAFSGNGTTWSDWVAYATTYSSFNVTTGEGCTSGDGSKIVYVKYKNDDDVESTKVYDTFYLDTVAPTLTTAAYTDVDSSGTVNSGDKITFTFIDEMLTSTVTASTVKANLLLSSSKSYGTSPTVSWDSGLKTCYVTLGVSPTLVVGTTTVTPTASVKDTAGNAYASTTAVTITGTSATTITTAAISGVTAPVTGATPDLTVTATAQYSGVTTWSSTPATFAASTTYTATIILTAKTGYTLTGVTANFFTVAGATATNSANSGVVTAVFPATAAATAATAPTAVLAVGSATAVGGVTTVAIPAAGATDTTGAVTGWVTGSADMIKFTVTDGGSAASTITIGGNVYASGTNYTIPSTTSLSIIVTTAETGKTTCVRTFTVSVAAADTTAPTATLALAGVDNSATRIVATFSEDLYKAGTAVADNAAVTTSFTATGGSLAITIATYDVTTKTITFTVASAANTNTIQHKTDDTKLTDAVGNPYPSKTYTYDTGETVWVTD